ncbi:MAG: hypothetical protein UT34_C0001G0082 [candidate division WS6 bacterium GW2011_GWF2_39_15]|uniref:Ribosomal RNA large subunit methyltransferase K/L-like methyltransferase domain-containing protein n=1 Tax=candidate division WS6 bacterium GW2011_GWF2_39_15 TaxID=1619100 RepID=A0A0G0QWM0_9BACT|nr:MAG: hypothetical protein UT34_C0001G0082 [candidate division WS6 bacterium GW2011_GWF2_39_15]
MKYFFIPGRNYDLSKAEIVSVFSTFISSNYNFQFSDRYILVDSKESPEVITRVFNRLGGFLSCGLIYDDVDLIIDEISELQRVTFGVSIYTDLPKNYSKDSIKTFLEQLKDLLKSKEVSSRYLMPNGLTLDSAQVLHNHLIDKGFELVIFDFKGKKTFGRTLGVQNIEFFSKVEFDKPYTNKEMGVLPAKLATIMINLLGLKDGETIWDPFCGSGTVPLVALSNGLNVLASDIDVKAVEGTQKNIEWLAAGNQLNTVNMNVFQFDVLNPDGKIVSTLRKTAFHGLASEPYMGPPQFKRMSVTKATKLLSGVESLYSNLFLLLENLKLYRFKAVIVVPSYKTFKGWMTISLNSIVSKKWKVESNLKEGDLHWKRSDSIIKRNIFVLSKKN